MNTQSFAEFCEQCDQKQADELAAWMDSPCPESPEHKRRDCDNKTIHTKLDVCQVCQHRFTY